MGALKAYFSDVGAGAADGSTWANRAPLLNGSNYSAAFLGLPYNVDGYTCYVEGAKNYAAAQTLASAGVFTNSPTYANSCHMHGCDSSGNPLEPPDGTWVSAQTPFNVTSYPTLQYTSNVSISTHPNVNWRCFNFTHSNRLASSWFSGGGSFDWCGFTDSGSNSTHAILNGVWAVQNCFLLMTGTAFGQIATFTNSYFLRNVRLDGGPNATSGTRLGLTTGNVGSQFHGLTIARCAGGGIITALSVATRYSPVTRCTLVDNGTYGILCNSTASQTAYHHITGNMIVNCNVGIDGNTGGNARIIAQGNRLRDNSTNNFANFGNCPTDDNLISAGTNADEFVDYANGDYRIKNTSSLWGKSYGAGDQPASGGAVTAHPLARSRHPLNLIG